MRRVVHPSHDIDRRCPAYLDEPPAEPQFTAALKFDDLEDLREGDINAQQLFMGGKLRMTGDYSMALQIAMGMMAKAQQR